MKYCLKIFLSFIFKWSSFIYFLVFQKERIMMPDVQWNSYNWVKFIGAKDIANSLVLVVQDSTPYK